MIDRLHDEGRADLARLLEKCGERISLTCTNCGTTKEVFRRCDNKYCPACAPLLAHRVVERLAPCAAAMRHPLFVTWTCRNWRDRIGLREFRRAFAKLIKLRWFKRAVPGGCAAFEVSRMTEKARKRARLAPRDGLGFHPHAHSLLDCNWLAITVPRPRIGTSRDAFKRAAKAALEEVAAQWSLAIGRPGTLAVRAVWLRDGGDLTDAMREVVKYSVSPDVLDQTEEPIGDLIDELCGTRNLTTFGNWYRNPILKKKPRDTQPCDCGACKSLMPTELVERFIARAKSDTRTSHRHRSPQRED